MRYVTRIALALSLVAFELSPSAADDVLVQARQQLDNGDPQAAYSLLVPLSSTRAGDSEFDFLLGSAALDLGKYTEAVLALERGLAVEPNNAIARTQIARAYFYLKETEAAKREFANVRKQEMPPEVSASIDRFMDAIQRIEDTQKTTINGYVLFGFGYDSNVNSATASSSVAIPAFGGQIFNLTSTSQSQSDGFFAFGGGLGLSGPITNRLSIFGNIAYVNKTNFHEDDFNTYAYDANLGVSYKVERDVFTLGAQYNSFYLNNTQLYPDAYRNAAGGVLQWQHDINAGNQISAYVQYAQLRFPSMSPMDVNRSVAGVGYARAFLPNGPLVYFGGYGGKEQELDVQDAQWGSDLYGARLGAQHFIGEKMSVFV